MDFFDLDFEQAKARHILFKTKLRSILYGADIDEAPVISHRECALGKWIYGHALENYGHIPEMGELEKVHATIHTYANELVSIYKNGEVDKAREGLSGMELISDNLATLLSVTEMKIKAGKQYDQHEDVTDKLNVNYRELLELQTVIKDLDKRIKEQTLFTAKARKKATDNEKRFRNLVTQSPIAMTILKGEDWIIDVANEAMVKNIWRRKLSDVEGKKLMDIFPELEGQQFPQLLRNVMITGKRFSESEAIAYVNSDDGIKKFYLDFEYAPFFETDGTISAILVTVNDVTEKVETRHKIEEAEKRYRHLIETLPVALFTIDKDGFINLYNTACEKLWGRKPEMGLDKWCGSEELYRLDRTFMAPEESPMAMAFKENRSIETEIYVKRPDGSLRHVIIHPQPMHDRNGNVTGAMNVLIDITERMEAEMALRSSEEKFRLIANFMPQFIWTADAEGNLNYFSQSVFDYSGLSLGQILRDGWLEIVHPDDREENVRLWTESVTMGKDFHCEHRFRRYDGVFRWQLSRAVLQKGSSENLQVWVGTSTDIHDRKLFTDELEIKVQQRTKELNLTNEDLLRSNSELTQFAYVASHDLQEPIRKIQTFISRIEEMENDNFSLKSRDYFNRISASSQRMQQLISDLLSFSRANAAQHHFEETDLTVLLQNVKDQMKESIEQKHAIITSSRLPVLQVITYQFEQLFTNLISNSLKFSKPGLTPRIDINYRIGKAKEINPTSAEDYHIISLADNGIGFESQFSDRIFQVFQRLHSKETYEGTGIGLAICKKIVENHKGFISASGELGKGATFMIYLPGQK
ncbi:MAG: PAS domain S-box protein [Chitinophagaceae bacterium]